MAWSLMAIKRKKGKIYFLIKLWKKKKREEEQDEIIN